ncbi:NAD(P)/FAD-dependent oxidoreductase [Rhodococcus sp. NPDC058505]|uniref:NAD(P)/FAD-dependent oxidoreductase n=1 Tax=unclassified Rhodococcus (in: high G+C Gram-positive bacteria) TaxID=192944 RepID=UPI003668D43F
MGVGRIVIVGAGLAGLRTAEELRRAGHEGAITLLGEESHLPYDRPPLSKDVVRGENDDVTLKPAEYYDELGVELRLGARAVSVDPSARTVTLEDGTGVDYDRLVIATGLTPRRIPGLPDLQGVHVLRTLDDSLALRADLTAGRTGLVVGAGFIGCEVAASMRARGLDVVLVEPQPSPLASVLGEQVGALVARLHTGEGVDVRTGVGLDSLRGDTRVTGAVLGDGTEIAADVVVVGIGSHPVTGWLEGSGIDLADRTAGGGVLADEAGRTSDPNVWVVGDVAAWRHPEGDQRRVEHWSNVGEQAKVLAHTLVTGAAPDVAAQVPYFWSDQYDVKIQALGEPSGTDTVHLVRDDGRKFLAYYERDGRLVAVVGGGLAGAVMKMRAKVAGRVAIEDVLAAATV